MKKLWLLISVILLVGCGQQSRNYTEYSLDMMGLKGSVKTLEQVAYLGEEVASIDFIDSGYFITGRTTWLYNEDGYMTACEDFSSDGQLMVTWRYTYDESGRNITFVGDFDDAVSSIDFLCEKIVVDDTKIEGMVYDQNGTEKLALNSREELYEDNRLMTVNDYDLEGQLISTMNYVYNNAGKIVEFSTHTNGYLSYKVSIEYEENLMSSYTFTTDQSVEKISVSYEDFDDHQNWMVMKLVKDGDVYTIKRTYTYY